MIQFLQNNSSEIFVMIFMAVWWMGSGFLSIKGDLRTFDQKRIAKDMAAMTDDEKLLLKQTLRLSVINNFIAVSVAGIVSLIVINLF